MDCVACLFTIASLGSYKFTGKERDSESNLDEFGARYYASSLGRFMTPDWATKPIDVPYANFGNPQSLNLYSYVVNNPLTLIDDDGHDIIYAAGLQNAQVVKYSQGSTRRQSGGSCCPMGARFTLATHQSLNRYAFTLNKPLRFVDPDGNDVVDLGRYVLTTYTQKSRNIGTSDWTFALGAVGAGESLC
jgi:RHS repeat-associated protein